MRIGTRGSKLALWQAEFTRAELAKIGIESELVIIKTRGDEIQHLGFDKMEGKGFFTKEIEDALLRGAVDLAVHSMKDLPTTNPEDLVTAGVSYRDDPADWLILRPESVDESKLFKVREGATIGTSAARRKAQFLDYRPDAHCIDLRGNVPTRLGKLADGQYDGIFLAAAGVRRLELDLSAFRVIALHPREFVPAPAQGVLAWQTHRDNLPVRRIVQKLHHSEVSACTNIERGVLRLLDGGCQLPLGVYAEKDASGWLHVWAASQVEGQLKRVRLSQSTLLGLAEKVVAELKKTENHAE